MIKSGTLWSVILGQIGEALPKRYKKHFWAGKNYDAEFLSLRPENLPDWG
jgi:hypothetical protein